MRYEWSCITHPLLKGTTFLIPTDVTFKVSIALLHRLEVLAVGIYELQDG